MKSKATSLVLSVGLVFGLALGCGGGDGPRDVTDNTSGSGSVTAGTGSGGTSTGSGGASTVGATGARSASS